ncbi:MAG: ribosome biogenesis GTP-binding protein YihA/YsxC [Candidatus Zixiibacteriota bacterium]
MKQLHCQFIGSFFNLDQLPKDDRPQIAFAGRSNVGKSTLINKLTGQKKLAKVAKTPGKTRSINFYLADNQFYFVDLPGYGYARASKKERAGWGKLIEDYFNNNYLLVGLILLLDCRREATDDDLQLIDWLSKKKLPAILISF